MKVIFGLVIANLFMVSGVYAQRSTGCEPATAKDKTTWGHIATETQSERSVKVLKGTVRDRNGAPIGGALVEIFADLGKKSPTSDTATRLVGCITEAKGRFRFEGLTKGRYILAVGADGFNITFVRFTHEPKARKAVGNLDVSLEIGT